MTAAILDGKQLARQIREELHNEVAEFMQNNGEVPTLAAVLVGRDPASEVYVRNKVTGCEQVGMQSRLFRLPADVSQEDELLALIARLNKAKDEPVHGILVQLPLPRQIEVSRILHAVSPLKDVDAFHPENVGRLVQGNPRFLPCTPSGIQQLLLRDQVAIAGRRVVVVGRGETVGKPMALMLMQRGRGGDATVTVCHSKTRDLREITRQADILIVAIGRPRSHHGRHGPPRRHRGRRGRPSHGRGASSATSTSPAVQRSGRPHHPRARRRRPVDRHDAAGRRPRPPGSGRRIAPQQYHPLFGVVVRSAQR